jgi:hypothetical protein
MFTDAHWLVRVLAAIPIFPVLLARIFGVGFHPEHVAPNIAGAATRETPRPGRPDLTGRGSALETQAQTSEQHFGDVPGRGLERSRSRWFPARTQASSWPMRAATSSSRSASHTAMRRSARLRKPCREPLRTARGRRNRIGDVGKFRASQLDRACSLFRLTRRAARRLWPAAGRS